MKLRIFVYRLVAALTAFVFGFSIFNAWQYFQTPETVIVTALALTKQEPVFAPPPVEPLSAVVDSKTETQEETNAETEFDAEGFYYIIDDSPKGFEDFDAIEITTVDYETASEENDYKGTPIAPEGHLRTNRKFNFTRISISEKNMTFQTEAVKGVSYKFSGKFLEKGAFWNLESQTPVLEGRLVKLQSGKKAVEKNVRLGWYAGGC